MDPSSDDLSPLPADHRRGLIAVAVLAAFSFVSSTVVLLYLSVKLARWHIRTWRQNRKSSAGLPPVDLSLGLTEQHFMGEDAKRRGSRTRKRAHPNQFLILIYNLLLADIHQAASFLLNAVWVGRNGIQVRTSTCWAQGWLVQTGDLASSLFITAIALHTYLAVVWNYTPPQSAIYITVVFLWGFNYLLVIIGIAITGNGKEAGGFFVRASAWCWINIRYEGLRLYLHYLWIFVALAITSVLYTLIFLAIRKRNPNNNTNLPPPTTNNSTTNIHTIPSPTTPHHLSHTPSSSITSNSKSPSHTTLTPIPSPTVPTPPQRPQKKSHENLFLLYPLIYILCTLPLALGRIATMAGAHVPIAYFCIAGALITSNGWLDVLLWGATRHALLFGADVDTQESGLDTFAFMRTPHGRRWGNIVWVEGGNNAQSGGEGDGGENAGLGGWVRRRMGWRELVGFAGSGGTAATTPSGGGQVIEGRAVGGRREEPAGLAIQMDMVTTVVVETAGPPEGKGWGTRGRPTHTPCGSVGSRMTMAAYDQADLPALQDHGGLAKMDHHL